MPNININDLKRVVLANSSIPKTYEDPAKTLGRINEYNDTTLSLLTSRHFTKRKDDATANDINLSNLITYLQPVHANTVNVIQDAERIRELAPEIPQAENIIVSSIMSPNDLQDKEPNIVIENIPFLSDTVKLKLETYLETYFNNVMSLGDKMTNSAKEALYHSGADVYLTLPEHTLAKLAQKYNVSDKGYESFETGATIFTKDHYNDLLNAKPFSGGTHKTGVHVGVEKTAPSITVARPKHTENGNCIIPESYRGVANSIRSYMLEEYKSEFDEKSITSGLETITAKIITELENGDTLKISENPEVLRFGRSVRNYAKNNLNRRFESLYNDAKDTVSSEQQTEAILDLTPYIGTLADQKGHPYCINIPAEAVIPICVPGTKSKHLGYFILIDSLGHPIKASSYITNASGCGISNRVTAAYTAMFGAKPTNQTGIKSPYELNTYGLLNSDSKQKNAVSKVFTYVLDDMLRQKLNDVGLNNVSVEKYETIATCMFYRLLENKQTALVFVPEKPITYIAFDYRENGTGKNKLEDINFILSLRVTFLTANMMALMKNAVAKKEIEVGIDKKETNVLGLVDQIKNAVLSKYSLNLSTNVQETAMNILNQNISIRTMPHPNAPGLDIKSTDTQSQVPKSDSELNDTISTWLTSLLDVPYAAMNQTNENEYMRSVATTNLFFSKKIRTLQKTLCKKYSEFIVKYIRYSPELINGIKMILAGGTSGEKPDPNTISEPPLINNSIRKDGKSETNLNELVIKILNNLKVELPAPNIAPDKAQFDIFKEFIETLEFAMNSIYDDQMAGTDTEAQDGLKLLKATIKASLAKQFANKMGIDATITTIDDIEQYVITHGNSMYSNVQTLKQIGNKLSSQKDLLETPTDTTTKSTSSTDDPNAMPDDGSDMSSGSSTDLGSDFNF